MDDPNTENDANDINDINNANNANEFTLDIEDYTSIELLSLLDLTSEANEHEIEHRVNELIEDTNTPQNLKPFLFQIQHRLLEELRLQDVDLLIPKDARNQDLSTTSSSSSSITDRMAYDLSSSSATTTPASSPKDILDLKKLDASLYTEEELMDFFDLGPKEKEDILKYNKKDVLDIAYRELLQNVRESNTLQQEHKEHYIAFIRQGRDALLNRLEDRIATDYAQAPQASNITPDAPDSNHTTSHNLITQDFIDAIKNQSDYDIRNAPTNTNSDASTHLARREQTEATHTDEAPRAIINPLRRQTLTHQVSIDSLFRKAYYTTPSTDFVYHFNYPLRNVISMKLTAMELPNIWYSFSDEKRNNIFYIDFSGVNFDSVANRGVSDTIEIRIPEGNYTPDEFVDTMNAYFRNHPGLLLDPTSPTTSPSLQYLRFLRFEFDEITARMILRTHHKDDSDLADFEPAIILFVPDASFSATGAINNRYSPDFEFTLRFELPDEPNRLWYKNAGWMIGFQEPIYTINKHVPPFQDLYNTGLTFPYRIKAEGVFGNPINSYVFLSIDDYNHNTKQAIMSGNDNALLYDNILARISVTSGSNTIIVDNAGDKIFKKRIYFGPVTIDKLRIRLIDRFGDVINLNDNDMSLALEFQQIYS